MRSFYTSVVELRQEFEDVIETHPYECGWADEAIFFVEIHDCRDDVSVDLRVQISADGIRWMDEGTRIETNGTAFARVTHFGGFLRLTGRAADADGRTSPIALSVRLALKG